METSGEVSNRKGIEKIICHLNCPRALKCCQAGQGKFTKAKETGAVACQLKCLETKPRECSLAQLTADASSCVCTCLVRTYIAGKMRATTK
jgi:hypothetical protein